MPKVTKKKAKTNTKPKRNSEYDEEEQTVITTADEIDQSKSAKGVKRKASVSVKKVKINCYMKCLFVILLFILF